MIFEQIRSTNSLRKCMEISLENLYVDTGAYRVKQLGPGRKESICVPRILFKKIMR